MTKLLAKENRLSLGLSEEGKQEKKLYTLLFWVFYLLGAFLFFAFMYDLCNGVGAIVSGTPSQAIVQWKRMAPSMLSAVTAVVLGLRTYAVFTATSANKRGKGWLSVGIFSVLMGVVIAGLVVFGVLTGEYHQWVEGYVTKLFPLDVMLLGVLFLLFGVFGIRYSKKIKIDGSQLPDGSKTSFAKKFARGLSYTVSVYSLAACVYGTYVMDWSHGNLFFNVMLWLNFAVTVAMVLTFRFGFASLKKEFRAKAAVRMGLCFLLVNVVLFGLYLTAVELQNEAPNLNAFGILPVEFTASFNAFLPIYGLNNLLTPAVALLTGLLMKKKQK